MKTIAKKKAKAETKAKAKVAAKIGRKAAKLAVLTAIATSALCGCSTAKSDQPAKSQTQSNTFDDCIVIIATQASVSNRVVRADGTADFPAVEMFTQTQSADSSGTETYSPSNTQTPTTDVKPDLDVRYNDAIAGASSASKGILESLESVLTDAGKASLLAMVESKSSGTVKLDKKDGGQVVVRCENGSCAECTDCEEAAR